MEITEKEKKALLASQQGELDAVQMYQALAIAVRSEADAAVFRTLAAEEGKHAGVFYSLTQEKRTPDKKLSVLLTALYRVLGRKRLYPLIAKGEYAAAKRYASLTEKFPEVKAILNDENRHGDMIMALLANQ